MVFSYVLYGTAFLLLIYIVVNVIVNKKFNVSDAMAALGIIVTILIALDSGNSFADQQKPNFVPDTPTSTPVIASNPVETQKPVATATSSQFKTLIFSDDLENGNKNFTLGDGSGSLNLVNEENGNTVLELSEAGIYTLLVNFGPENISDCAIEYRVKIVKMDNVSETSGTANLLIKHMGLGKPTYVFSFDPYHKITQFYYYPPFQLLQGIPFGMPINIETGKWYDIRVEIIEGNFYASIDGVSVLHGTDSRLQSGKLGFQIYSNTTNYFDDVKIWSR
jgi:hypothetical protein